MIGTHAAPLYMPIVCGTTEGQTHHVCQFIKQVLAEHEGRRPGHSRLGRQPISCATPGGFPIQPLVASRLLAQLLDVLVEAGAAMNSTLSLTANLTPTGEKCLPTKKLRQHPPTLQPFARLSSVTQTCHSFSTFASTAWQ